MKNIIIKALDEAMKKLDKQIPTTKKAYKSISIDEIKPIDLTNFMKTKNIPDNANFTSTPNSYDGYDGDYKLEWEIDVPTTDKDVLAFKKKRFTQIAWKFVYDLLIANGYKRVGFDSGKLKEFDNITIYDMYLNNDFDMLVRRYSLSYKKEGAK